MYKAINKGFTLIELLVVIAIIGILAGIVLASLGTARNKSKDATIQEQMSSMRTAAEIYYSNNGNSYGPAAATCSTGMFGDGAGSNFAALVNAVATALNGSVVYTNMTCGSTTSVWSVLAKLPSNPTVGYWCVDSTGTSKAEAAAGVAGATACL